MRTVLPQDGAAGKGAADEARHRAGLPAHGRAAILPAMWNEPYLETCCRSALHRLLLCGEAGRPDAHRAELKDARCLDRLGELGLAEHRGDRYRITAAGEARHELEIMKIA